MNDTPGSYYCPLGFDGRRADWRDQAELSRGTVDYVATETYLARPPQVKSPPTLSLCPCPTRQSAY